jgi:hypothetical protein
MRPPRSRDHLAIDHADGAGQQFVLQEKQAVPLERRG